MSKQVRSESGEWRDGAAAPKLLPEPLRKLPGELVTGDADDEHKVHELDAPHIVSSLVKDFGKSLEPEKVDTAQKLAKKLWAPGPGERAPVTQWFVDVAKMRVIASLVNRAVDQFSAGLEPDMSVKHLWFPTTNVNEYELRSGNPPARKARPRYLWDIDLVVDVLNPPRTIVEELKKRGIDLDIQKALRQAREGDSVIVAP